ncbi:MAG TPA: methyltransferase domain-containing protein [Abditibacteriaceae bacterium]|nr:methyltransferase domain-containing protein [Abditibacteriaceae bacterium]
MNSPLLDYLADPNDGHALEVHAFEGSEQETREGVLLNSNTGRWYPIQDGIPSLFADALREDYGAFVARFGAAMAACGCRIDATESSAAGADLTRGDFSRIESERRARDEQAEDYDRMFSLRFYQYIEAPAYRRALGEDTAAPLLEAGCGTGRFTGLFAELAPVVVAIDMSRASILRNRVRHSGKTAAPVHYVHADLTHLPLRDATFGRIAHCGVYEHIPSRAMREQFLQHARRVLQPRGQLLLAAYCYRGLTKLLEKEGEHAGGIPFTRFTEAELRAEVEPYFVIEKFRPSLGVYMSLLVARSR